MSYAAVINKVFLALAFAALAACGGGSEEGGLPGTGGGGAGGPGGVGSDGLGNPNSNPPASIVLTQPILNAIENLGNGNYRIKMSAIVSDAEGNAVADGTSVNLFMIDSVKARGTIDMVGSGDSLSGSTLTDMAPVLGGVDNAMNTDVPTGFTAANVQRDGVFHFVEPGDHVVLQVAEREDQARIVSAASLANSLNVGTPFINSYPNSTYDGSDPTKTVQYFVGESLLSAAVAGSGGNVGKATTTGGIAEFFVTYPANGGLLTGCTSTYDLRTNPKMDPSKTGGAYIIATIENDVTVSDVDPFCFSPIAGATLGPFGATTIGPGTTAVTFQLRDGGDTIPIPYAAVVVSIDTSGGNATTTDQAVYFTDGGGRFTSLITVANMAATEAKVTFSYTGDASGVATITGKVD